MVYLSASEIASHLPTTNPDVPSRLDRMLRLFASHSLLSSSSVTRPDGIVQTVYSLTPACEFFLTDGEQPSLAPMSALSHHRFTMDAWMHVKDAILEGGNMFRKVHGETIFEQMKKDETFNKTFNEGLAGIQHVGGDMLKSIPTGQAIMIKDTCHNWSDEIVIRVLKNIYEALENNGKVIIVNAILPEKPETTKASQYVSRLDNTMLMQSSGIERTAKQFECLVMAAGFSNFRVACVACGIWAVMESYKY